MKRRSLNHITLLVFAPLLILTGIAGFVIPAEVALTSGAPLYNIFHLAFGSVGLAIFWAGKERLTEIFNIGFGLIDLYQALASFMNWFPEQSFQWTSIDDDLHIVIGIALVAIGCYGALTTQAKAGA